MSRVGNALIQIPAGVEINNVGQTIEVKGPKGSLSLDLRPEVKVEIENEQGSSANKNIVVKRKKDDRLSRSLHGLTRALINNMVIGVNTGWTKNLEMVGVGYRVSGTDKQITLSVGFSHPVVIDSPEGINLVVSENTKISVSGIDKTLVGQVAAKIRAIRPPEVYKGKGIRYAGEHVRRKPGKAGKGVAK